MEIVQPSLASELGPDNKRQCIRIKARIKISANQLPLQSTQQPHQAYCETIASSRPQSPDFFDIPPSRSLAHSSQPVAAPRYTARITSRKRTTPASAPNPQHHTPTAKVRIIRADKNSKHDASASPTSSEEDTVSASRLMAVAQLIAPRDSHLKTTADAMSRNTTQSLPQAQKESPPKPTAPVITARTPLRQKRYVRMEYHPLPPSPPSPPDAVAGATTEQSSPTQPTVNFSRGETRKTSQQTQQQTAVPHLKCVNARIPPPLLPPQVHHYDQLSSTTDEDSRPQSKSSRRTVTFADDTTLSSRSSSPDRHSNYRSACSVQSTRQSRGNSMDTQIPSILRLYGYHDDILTEKNNGNNGVPHASRRTIPKDSKHKYPFGQRPTPKTHSSPGLNRLSTLNYNPRLSTSKAQYRGLQTLPPPLPILDPQPGPRHPPWGTLTDLSSQREKRGDARDRAAAKQFRATTLSQATTVASTGSFLAHEDIKKEVQEYKEQVVSVYPDMAFDGSAGKGGRGCCCAVM